MMDMAFGGCCSILGAAPGLFWMATLLLVVGAIAYLLTKQSETSDGYGR